MKILMVISQFYPLMGGAERQAQLLARTLVRKGMEVSVVTGWWKSGTPRKERVDGVNIIRNFCCWGMFGIKLIWPFGFLSYVGGLIYVITLGLYLLLHRREYDLIHVHQALYPAFVSVLVGKGVLGRTVIVKTASSGLTSDIKQLRHIPFGGLQLSYLLKKMECLVAVSKISGKEFIEIGYPESRMVYIPNGVTVSAEGKKTYDHVETVLTTARLSREKGIDVLLRAWARVAQEEKALKLVIVGQGPLESELRKLSDSLGCADSVDFVGLTYNIEEYLEKADLFVLPSRTEGLSNALLEAMANGIPCVATKVGGNDELLEGEDKEILQGGYVVRKNGLLVNPEDPEGLSKAVLYLVWAGKEKEEIARRGRRYIQENYSIDRVADTYIALYQRLLDRRS
jgi:glycosyltransferase involved in cell wall biosynthesis